MCSSIYLCLSVCIRVSVCVYIYIYIYIYICLFVCIYVHIWTYIQKAIVGLGYCHWKWLRWLEFRSCARLFTFPMALIPFGNVVFTNGPGDLGSIPGLHTKDEKKIVLDTSLLNTQQYKVRIIGKVEQSKERNSTFTYISV